MPKHAQNTPDGTSSNRDRQPDERIGLTEAFAPVPSRGGAHAGGFSYRGDNDAEYPDAFESLEPHEEPPLLFGDDAVTVEPDEPKGRHGKKPKKPKKPPLPPHMRKSRRMRRILIVIVLLLVVLIAALAYYTWQLIDTSQTLASQQSQEQQSAQEVEGMSQGETKDPATTTTKKTEVPNLADLLGLGKDEAIATIQRGATVTREEEVKEEGNPVKTSVTVALTDEPADTRSGTPTVYLGLGEDGKIIQAGYSAATASLGYGSLSFVDAVKNEHIVEKTLQEAGIDVPEGTAELPEDKTAYSTYDTDGTTLVKERSSFSGSIDLDGAAHEWSSVLLYDYTNANTSGNLADTIRIIYVYINA